MTEFLRVVRPDGLVVFGLPYYIPSLWSTPAAPARLRAAAAARRLGAVDAAADAADADADDDDAPSRTCARCSSATGASVLQTEPIDEGPIRALRYYVSPA